MEELDKKNLREYLLHLTRRAHGKLQHTLIKKELDDRRISMSVDSWDFSDFMKTDGYNGTIIANFVGNDGSTDKECTSFQVPLLRYELEMNNLAWKQHLQRLYDKDKKEWREAEEKQKAAALKSVQDALWSVENEVSRLKYHIQCLSNG